MADDLKKGDHVRWNSDVGLVQGVVVRKHTKDVEFDGRMRRCSPEEPQYEVKSDKTGALAMHKADALHRV